MAVVQAMEEPLRSQMLYGDFTIGQKEDINQVVPSGWVRLAMNRWSALQQANFRPNDMDALGVDVARGGKDKTVLTPRHGVWFGPQQVHPGKTTPRRKPSARGIAIESKDDIITRIGRSPDKGESLVYAHATPRQPPAWAM